MIHHLISLLPMCMLLATTAKAVVLDAAHNEHAMAKVLRDLAKLYDPCKITLVMAVSAGKDINAILSCAFADKSVQAVYFISGKHPRLLPYNAILPVALDIFSASPRATSGIKGFDFIKDTTALSTEQTLLKVLSNSNPNDVILVCGSFFIMEEVRRCLGFEDATSFNG